ncbi:hypothetical protein [Candidatus Nitronereus thalassa]|uniref:Uncharacterized protein n=1 Tax=Candidatus Nitronereus thalassa TaxID=3020898 RepID=A0ABU3KCR0_9BACT|nr:hypothetical protein [Candidatus Nitronereus thalassa]MDT7044216.1 hypothetical protein [Candidatus Nitronereus thalassa]
MPSNEEIFEKYTKRLEELERIVSIKDDHIVINVCYEYNISLSDCRTHQQILSWVHHLCEKTWMAPEVLEKFIEVACRANGLELKK